MTLVLIGVWTFFWRVRTFQNEGQRASRYLYPGSPTTIFYRLVDEAPFVCSKGLSSSKRNRLVLMVLDFQGIFILDLFEVVGKIDKYSPNGGEKWWFTMVECIFTLGSPSSPKNEFILSPRQ